MFRARLENKILREEISKMNGELKMAKETVAKLKADNEHLVRVKDKLLSENFGLISERNKNKILMSTIKNSLTRILEQILSIKTELEQDASILPEVPKND